MKKYSLTTSKKNNYVWFQSPKCASCTIRSYLEKYTNIDNNTRDKWIKVEYDPEKYKSYFKFVFVRNPFSRLVSAWADKIVETKHGRFQGDHIQFMRDRNFTFKQFVKRITTPGVCGHANDHWVPNLLNLPGKPEDELDFIGKVENFNTDLKFVLNSIGIYNYKSLPPINKTKHKHYTEYYDDKTRQLVTEKFAQDLKYFGYEFGD